MAFVRVEQRNARLAAAVRIDVVQGKDGPVSKGTVVAISNVRRQGAEDEATSIQWTLWGKQAESAAEYLGKGSRVNVVGRVQNNNYENADKVMVYGLTFTCEELDYLDTGSKARRVGRRRAHRRRWRPRRRVPATARRTVGCASPRRSMRSTPTTSRSESGLRGARERPAFLRHPSIEDHDMHTNPTLAARFARNTHVFRSDSPLGEEQMRAVAPSIFATGKHASRSERYAYIPTIDVLRGLRKQGFEPFMVAQSKSRVEGRSEYTKHMIRMRHAGQVNARSEANEIILINSHDGASSYQMLAGVFRFVCCNGLVWGTASNDIRIPHKGNVQHEVIEGAFRVLEDFEAIDASTEAMKALALDEGEERAFATAALALRYGERSEGQPPAPVTAEQLVEARRPEDTGRSLWTSFQRVQENVMRGGQPGRSTQGRRVRTREVASIDRGVSLNRALWLLAEEMRKLKS